MMSPDPPRGNNNEIRRDSSEPEGVPHFELLDEEDIMGTGEHVLDYSSQPESPGWTSDEGDNDTGATTTDGGAEEADAEVNDEADESGNTRARARYTLLIPFQVVPDDHNDSDSEEDDNSQSQLQQSDPSSAIAIPSSVLPTTTSNHPPLTSTKREIVLSDDKLETIKQAMKSFKLPESAIPAWASEVTEEAWKKKVIETVNHNPNSQS